MSFPVSRYLYCHSKSPSAPITEDKKEKRSARGETIRINRETYTIPEPCRSCPGENGAGVSLTADESKGLEEIVKKEFFNLRASDKVSLWRSIPDTRDGMCHSVQYPTDLPSASVVIVFKNERWSPVLRTVYSVLNRSPKHLLKEVILVDDLSDIEEMGQKLDEYCEKHFGDLVRILRAPNRLGLIKAKNYGAKNATGDVVVFLDAHCEANVGWLEPLLARIKEKRSAILCPSIDMISEHNMQYSGTGFGSVGGFWWSLHFNWKPIPQRTLNAQKSRIDPYPCVSPTMAGGLLAADRKYFFEIGGYDEDMEVWGGENLELSFRVWMCHGSLEFVPCSRVGHIFRPGHPYNMTGLKGNFLFLISKGDVHGRNSMRLAEVWMDDYKRLYYMHRRELIGKDFGDVEERRAIRTRLQCHSFKWFLDNVFPEKFILDENVLAYGEVRENTLGKDEKGTISLAVYSCQNGASANQYLSLTKTDQLRREDTCSITLDSSSIVLTNCDFSNQKQSWKHEKNGTLIHYPSKLCLDVEGLSNDDQVKLKPCEANKLSQICSTHQETESSNEVTSTINTTETEQSLSGLIHEPSWAINLGDLFNDSNFQNIEKFLNNQWSSGKVTFPPKNLIFEAFNKTPFNQVKVVLLGQDPYHDDGQAHGLAFSVPKTITTLPPSLKNIYKELANDISTFKTPNHGCLEKWTKSGVLLLNATLTVEPHLPNSHSRIGWMKFTDGVIKLLSDKHQGLVFLLWGGFAHAKEKLIDKTKHTVIKTAHPSPLSFNKFSNCKCFSLVNAALQKHGQQPIDWSL
ncbi:hypothetical protein I4U23_029982 [Adineta vaga]|nr:hypothetical protein I4U23_029982 [Adineta vaga]